MHTNIRTGNIFLNRKRYQTKAITSITHSFNFTLRLAQHATEGTTTGGALSSSPDCPSQKKFRLYQEQTWW